MVITIEWLIIIMSSIWVFFDSKEIGAKKGLITGFANMGPVGWFFSCLFLWLIGFPMYLATRSRIKAAASLINKV